MTNDQFKDIVNQALALGVRIVMYGDDSGVVWYDMDTCLKSSFRISLQNGVCVGEGRYDVRVEIDDFEHLKFHIRKCAYGRDPSHSPWASIF